MVILELEITHFGKLKNKKIVLRPGMNVISGSKDAGKTTISAFVEAILFGLTDEKRRQYYPTDFENSFGGTVKVLENGLFYSISRYFLNREDQLFVRKLSDQSFLPNPEEWIQKAIGEAGIQEYREYGFLTENKFIQGMYDARARVQEENNALLEYEKTLNSLEDKKNSLKEKEKALTGTEEIEALKQEEAMLLARKQEREDELGEVNSKYQFESMQHLKKLQQKSFQIQKEVKELKHQLVTMKDELNGYANIPEKGLALRNFIAIAFLAAGVLAGLVAYFLYSSECYEVLDITDQNQLRFWISAGTSVVLLITGIILAICFAVKKAKVVKLYEEREQLYEKACKTEAVYEDTLRRAASVNVEAQNKVLESEKDAHAKDVLELMSVISSMNDRLEAIARKKADFENGAEDELNALQAEILSVDMSIESVRKMQEEELQAKEERKTPMTALDYLKIYVEQLDRIEPRKAFPLVLDETLDRFAEKEREEAMSYLRSIGRQVLLLTELRKTEK